MNTFIKKIFLFILPILFCLAIGEFSLRRIPNDYKLQKAYLDKNASEIETLILGSSHTYYGVNPIHLSSNSFNAGYISQPYEYDLAILKKYISDWKKLKTVIIPVSYFSFFSNLKDSNEFWRVKNYVLYEELDVANKYIDFSEVFSNKLPINIKRLYYYYILNDSKRTSSNLGWGMNFSSKKSNDLESIGKKTALKHSAENFNLYKENSSLLSQIITLCNSKGINVFLFTPPAYKTYRENLNPKQYTISINTVEQIARDNNNCYYLNLIDTPSFKDEDFHDGDHLNEIGAKKLSLLIDEIIKGTHY